MSEGFKGLRLYNTLTRTKEDFVPIDPANVRMYVCGPTVYDYAHIGNARPAIVFDVLFRLLRHLYGPDHVTYVRNITDVDDKINARALRDYGAEIEAGNLSLNEAIRKVTEPTYEQYQKDVTALGCLPPTVQPRATEYIEGMIAMIQTLLDKDHAYVAQGEDGRETLFDVRKMEDYGALSRRKLEEMFAGARVEVKDHKRNPGDFVLWKESNELEPGWDANFRISDDNRDALRLNTNEVSIRGRPGWHIECSVMSDALLWDAVKDQLSPDAHKHPHQFDIHGGGLDLIFPHHENEIAQSRCAHGTDVMANYWLHNGFLQVEGKKMSKSEGNFVTIHELLAGVGRRPRAGAVVRLAMLATHYRQPIDFTEQKLDYWYNKLSGWIEAYDLNREETFAYDRYIGLPVRPNEAVVSALLDDLNFANALASIEEIAQLARAPNKEAANELGASLIWLGLLEPGKEPLFRHGVSGAGNVGSLFAKYWDAIIDARALVANEYGYLAIKDAGERHRQIALLQQRLSERFPEMASDNVRWTISEHCDVTLDAIGPVNTGSSGIEEQIARRLAFIRDKNWAEADRIRDELLAQGIQLKDGKDPATGERITTWEVKR
ncbi:MAG: cysteine--tRNA ligase [Mesorhizobium sp.]|nr:cysteine--tRNA ligase [Mesorhizobium sp.]MCO5159764.1 cysteine--tRNA ligase [Mesorhizobium sp.]